MYKLLLVAIFLLSVAVCQSFMLSSTSTRTTWLNMVKVGDIAPDFELKNAAGKSFKLSSYRGKKPVVVFFYPADSSPGCTKEVCAFEKKAPDFKAKGAEVFGISDGDAASKNKFISATNLKLTELLIDAKNAVRTSWEVPKAVFGLLGGRVTYVIGKDGTVKSIYDDIAKAEVHPDKALEALAAEVPSSNDKKNLFGIKF